MSQINYKLRKLKHRKKIFILVILVLVVSYLFWGPLFPWNPIKIGYKKIESSKATVYITDYNREDVIYDFDEIIEEEEKFHGLRFKEKFKVIILGKESNMKRYLPWMSGSGYSVKLGSLNLIYIGANARNSPYGIEVFLKHEISHLLIHQNTSSHDKNMKILKQGWLAEGVATYIGGPHYYEKNEFIELWNANGFQFNSLYMENPHEMSENIIRLKYTYYRFFTEFLIETFGIENFQAYIKSYIDNPQNYEVIFSEIHNKELNEILRDFDAYMEL